jgi:hypothetical protein
MEAMRQFGCLRSGADTQSETMGRSLVQQTSANEKPRGRPRGFVCVDGGYQPCASTASSNSATMLVILIIGFTAGPAVSL